MLSPGLSPMEHSPNRIRSSSGGRQRQSWLMWAAIGWLVFLILYLPYPNTSRTPPGAFFQFKVITTLISAVAVVVLIYVPRGWWKAVTILLASLLVFVQVVAWTGLP
jgi:hypothetical protein